MNCLTSEPREKERCHENAFIMSMEERKHLSEGDSLDRNRSSHVWNLSALETESPGSVLAYAVLKRTVSKPPGEMTSGATFVDFRHRHCWQPCTVVTIMNYSSASKVGMTSNKRPFFFFLMQGFLCSPGCCGTQRFTCCFFLSAGIKSMSRYTLVKSTFLNKSLHAKREVQTELACCLFSPIAGPEP